MCRLSLTGADVEVVSGPDRGLSAPIEPGGLRVGTSSGMELRLTDDLVSRRHVELTAQQDGVRVVDLGSLNGTWLGGARVREVLLRQDALLELGSSVLALRLRATPIEIVLSARGQFGSAIGASRAMRHVFFLLEQAARNNVTVLLEGESGTGKDVLANALHEESDRREGPFVVVDCGAIPESLVESELFGHERGAFTGAITARAGAFELAHGGTLFLDEIGELALEMQPKLLRVLESRSFRRVGGSRTMHVDVRVVAASNRNLREAVANGAFRKDLYYRIAVVRVTVPSLADRPEDVAPLAELFLRRATGNPNAVVPPDLARLLAAYGWPGNARELRNVVERYATFEHADARLLFAEPAVDSPAGEPGAGWRRLEGLVYHEAKRRLLEEYHRAVLPRIVQAEGASVARAAQRLGIPRASLYRMLKGLGEPGPDDEG
jgi:transcriptional regulator with PAS, ATPase and Fis domain